MPSKREKPVYTALEDLSHDSKLAEALGNMVVAWAHAEIVLFSTYARAAGLGLNMAMESYYRIPTFESRVRFVLALLGEWDTDKFDVGAIRTAVQKLAQLARTRNHWVHGDWCIGKDEMSTVIFDHRATINSKDRMKPVKAADVTNHNAAVKRRAGDIAKLIDWRGLKP